MTEQQHLTAQIHLLRAQLDKLQTARNGAEVDEMERVRVRADSVAAMFGERMPAPVVGQTPLEYRRACADRMKKHSSRFKNENLYGAGSAALSIIEDHIYADAAVAARHSAEAKPGVLVPVTELDPAGRTITKFVGDPMAWMNSFVSQGVVGTINRTPGGK